MKTKKVSKELDSIFIKSPLEGGTP